MKFIMVVFSSLTVQNLSFNMRSLLFVCGILLFASLMNSSEGAPLGEEEEAGDCPNLENKEWNIGDCNHCFCRNGEVFCESTCEDNQ